MVSYLTCRAVIVLDESQQNSTYFARNLRCMNETARVQSGARAQGESGGWLQESGRVPPPSLETRQFACVPCVMLFLWFEPFPLTLFLKDGVAWRWRCQCESGDGFARWSSSRGQVYGKRRRQYEQRQPDRCRGGRRREAGCPESEAVRSCRVQRSLHCRWLARLSLALSYTVFTSRLGGQ